MKPGDGNTSHKPNSYKNVTVHRPAVFSRLCLSAVSSFGRDGARRRPRPGRGGEAYGGRYPRGPAPGCAGQGGPLGGRQWGVGGVGRCAVRARIAGAKIPAALPPGTPQRDVPTI